MTVQCGLGIRPEFVNKVLTEKPDLGFLEAHSENYFGDSLSRAKLLELCDHYPVSLHGVGLSLGRADDLDQAHLQNLKQLVNDVQPLFVSEHLAWSAYSHRHIPDLLPLPLTRQALDVMCQHVDQMQQTLGRQVLVENPSNYLLFDQLQLPEPEFLNLLAERTECGLLVDINNIYVSAVNVDREPLEYLQALNSSFIVQYHLAGYTEVQRVLDGESTTLLIDTHNKPVYEPVWSLFEQSIKQHGARPTIFEWDSDFPELDVLLGECEKANSLLSITPLQVSGCIDAVNIGSTFVGESEDLAILQTRFLDDLVSASDGHYFATDHHKSRISVYQNNFFVAMQDYLADIYPAVKGVVGDDFFKQMVRMFLQIQVPSEGNIHHYGGELVAVIEHFEGLDSLPYLSDLLSYEWALHSAYYSDTSRVIDPASISEQELLSLNVALNDSVYCLSSSFPIYEIHRQSLPNYDGDIVISLDQSQDDILVYKHHHEVNTVLLSKPTLATLVQIQKAQNLLQAIDVLSGSINSTDLSVSLSFVFEKQLLRSVTNFKTLP